MRIFTLAFFALSLCTLSEILAQTSPSRLSNLDALYQVQPRSNIGPVVDTAFTPELQSASTPTVVKELVQHTLATTQSEQHSMPTITSETIAKAFNAWVDTIGAAASSHVTPSDVSAHRIFLSHFAPNLFTRGNNSVVHHDLSPAEGLYLLDRMISQGGCPRLTSQNIETGHYIFDPATDSALPNYRASSRAYYARTPEAQRIASFRAILVQANLL